MSGDDSENPAEQFLQPGGYSPAPELKGAGWAGCGKLGARQNAIELGPRATGRCGRRGFKTLQLLREQVQPGLRLLNAGIALVSLVRLQQGPQWFS